MTIYNAVVIGGGPGGYTAAIRISQLGGKVVLIEKNKLGGVCNNYGCIPSKTMLRIAEVLSNLKIVEGFGLNVQRPNIDFKKLIKNRNELLDKLAQGVETLLRNNKVKLIFGQAYLKHDRSIIINKTDGTKDVVRAKNIIIATGSSPSKPRIQTHSKNVVNSEEFLSSDNLPEDILIAGGGSEGVEFAFMLSNLGCKVTLVEMMDRLLLLEDKEISYKIEKILSDNKIKILTKTKVTEIKDEGGKVKVKFDNGSRIRTEKVLISVGRKPNSQNLGLEDLNVKMNEAGRILVSNKMETSVKDIYAVGDVSGGRFAHEAIENGIIAAENIMGLNSSMDGHIMPRCIYSIPEIACAGLTEDEAKKNYDILVGKFSFKASGRAMTIGNTDGFVKVIIDKKSKKILGTHILGDRASDMIGEALIAMRFLTTDDIMKTIHPHPTLVEAIREAVMDAYGLSIHSLNNNKRRFTKSLKHYIKK